MIKYDTDKIKRMRVAETAAIWRSRDLVSKEEYLLIRQAYAGGYTEPRVLMRLGYFIFAFFCCLASLGIILLLFAGSSNGLADVASACIFWGGGLIWLNEFLVESRKMYRSGISHALLGFGLAGILISAGVLLNEKAASAHLGFVFFLSFLCTGFIAFRYLSTLFSLASWLCFLCFVFFSMAGFGTSFFFFIPFAGMGVSALLYMAVGKLERNESLVFHTSCLSVLKGAALFSFYLSGNYFVIHALSGFSPGDNTDKDIPFGILFYLLTIGLPVVYGVYGLAQKNRLFFRTGLICVLLAIATIRYFHTFLPAETGLTLGGVFLCLLAVVLIRWLKQERYGLTSVAVPEESTEEKKALAEIGKLVISSTVTTAGPATEVSGRGPGLGGGSGGGAGAGGDF